MSTPIKLVIADSAELEKVFVELSSPVEAGNHEFVWGIVSQEQTPLTLTIYPQHDGKPLVFNIDDVIAVLQRAKDVLTGASSTKSPMEQ